MTTLRRQILSLLLCITSIAHSSQANLTSVRYQHLSAKRNKHQRSNHFSSKGKKKKYNEVGFKEAKKEIGKNNKKKGGAINDESNKKQISSHQYQFLKLMSGGLAGTMAAVVTNPLEIVKAQLQSSNAARGDLVGKGPMAVAKTILERDGVGGMMKGLAPTLVGIIPARSTYFYAYSNCKKAISPYFKPGSTINSIISGAAAGITSNTITNPIWLIKTRIQLLADQTAGQRAYGGYRDAVKTIYKEEGVGGFYKGIFASYWGCAEGCVQFVIYEKLKNRLIQRQNIIREKQGLPPSDELPKWMYLTSAGLAKCIATVSTYPHEVARTRMREQARSGVFKYNGMWNTIGLIAKEEGRQGLYAGMGMHVLKVVPNSALMFLTYEVVNSWLDRFEVVDPIMTEEDGATH